MKGQSWQIIFKKRDFVQGKLCVQARSAYGNSIGTSVRAICCLAAKHVATFQVDLNTKKGIALGVRCHLLVDNAMVLITGTPCGPIGRTDWFARDGTCAGRNSWDGGWSNCIRASWRRKWTVCAWTDRRRGRCRHSGLDWGNSRGTWRSWRNRLSTQRNRRSLRYRCGAVRASAVANWGCQRLVADPLDSRTDVVLRDGQNRTASCSGTSVAHTTDISAKHVRERGHGVSPLEDFVVDLVSRASLSGRRHCNWCAVHVHFSITNFVKPGPCQSVVLASRNCIRDWEGEVVGSKAERIGTHIAGVCWRASSFDGLDDLEDGVFRRWAVGSKGDLTRASTMRSLSLEADGLRLANRHDVHFGHGIDSIALLTANHIISSCFRT